MHFSPSHPIIQQCMKAFALRAEGHPDQAQDVLRRAWLDAAEDHARLWVAYHLAHEEDDEQALHWLDTALELALDLDHPAVHPAVPHLHARLAEVHARLGHASAAARSQAHATAAEGPPRDPGPFFHGTRAALGVGDVLTAGRGSNYQSGLVMNHIYFTAGIDVASLAAAFARGDGRERVYQLEPTGPFEHDPNVTNQRFPGNPTRSYRSPSPLRIVGEAEDWNRPPEEVVRRWRARLADGPGEVIN